MIRVLWGEINVTRFVRLGSLCKRTAVTVPV